MAESVSQQGSFQSDLGALLESGEGADVTFVVGNSELHAHSFMLAVRSPVFAAMLRTPMLEASSRRIEVTDIQKAVLRQMMWFIYTDTVPQLQNMAALLLAAADKYDLPLLKRKCEQQMVKDLSVENAGATAALAILHSCPTLRTATIDFIARHTEVMGTAGWAQMLRRNVEAAIEICKQVTAVKTQPTLQPDPLKISTNIQSQRSVIPEELKRKMSARLLQAAHGGNAGAVWALLSAGAPKDARDAKENTALHLAAARGHSPTVKCLIDCGLDVDAVNFDKKTPLHLAAEICDDTNVIWMLVAASATVDAQDLVDQTPLHLAAERTTSGAAAVVKALLLAGAKKDVKDFIGNTPEDSATDKTLEAFRINSSPYYSLQ